MKMAAAGSNRQWGLLCNRLRCRLDYCLGSGLHYRRHYRRCYWRSRKSWRKRLRKRLRKRRWRLVRDLRLRNLPLGAVYYWSSLISLLQRERNSVLWLRYGANAC